MSLSSSLVPYMCRGFEKVCKFEGLKVRMNRFFCLFLTLMLLPASCRKKPAPNTTPLHWAAKTGDVQRLDSLISSGADVNSRDNDTWTSLHWAAHKGHKQAVELLISKEADVNAMELGIKSAA